MNVWFPHRRSLGNSSNNSSPSLRLLCFHGAGSDSSMFVSKGTRSRPLPNPLVTYCQENNVELLSAHLPGRTSRLKEPRLKCPTEIAEALLQVLGPYLAPPDMTPQHRSVAASPGVPLVVAGHSMGALCAYEFVCLLRQRGYPLPKHLLLSCMVSPDTQQEQRPWRRCDELDDEELKEECRIWGISKEVFAPEVWELYEPILRDDFHIIDSYEFTEPSKSSPLKVKTRNVSVTANGSPVQPASYLLSPTSSFAASHTAAITGGEAKKSFHAPLGVPTTLYHAKRDTRITPQLMEGWRRIIQGRGLFTTSPSGFGTISSSSAEFNVEEIDGGHNFFYEAEARQAWMESVTSILDKILIDLEYCL